MLKTKQLYLPQKLEINTYTHTHTPHVFLAVQMWLRPSPISHSYPSLVSIHQGNNEFKACIHTHIKKATWAIYADPLH